MVTLLGALVVRDPSERHSNEQRTTFPSGDVRTSVNRLAKLHA
jgi:hypothetical protein